MGIGRKAGSKRFQTIPCLHCRASLKIFACLKLRRRGNSCGVIGHAGSMALAKRMVLRSSCLYMARGPERETICRNWSMQILSEENLDPREEPHVSRRRTA